MVERQQDAVVLVEPVGLIRGGEDESDTAIVQAHTFPVTGYPFCPFASGVFDELIERTLVVQTVYGAGQERRQADHFQGQP